LQALAAQTGLDILFEPSAVAGLNAAAVRGEMRPGDALCLLLGDRGLAYSINPDHKIIISRRAMAAPVNPVAVEMEPVSDVIVTGTRRVNQPMESSLAPIAVFSAESLSQTGSADTAESLSQLLPSFNYPQPALTDGTDIVKPATLRGLQPDEMLVLVDGKRRHTSALLNINTTVGRGSSGVDLSLLPTAAIDRIEVLSGDAAAQYGSDAIAGVVNVLLKKQREGAEFNVLYGQNYTNIHGVPEAVGVRTDADGQPLIIGSGSQTPVYALDYHGEREAHDGQTVVLSGNIGLPLGSQGFLEIAGQGRDQSPTNRAGYNPQQQYPLQDSGAADPRELTFNRLGQRFGEPRIEDATLVVNAGVPLGETGAQWYGFGTYGARYGLTNGFYRSALDPSTLPDVYPDGFLPLIKADINDESVVTGLRGDFGRWNYDLSVNFGRDVMNFKTENSDNPDPPYTDATSFQDGGLRYQEYLFNFDLQREFALPWLARPLSAAWGLEYRAERFAIVAGEPASYVDIPALLWGINNPPPVVNSQQAFPGFEQRNVVDQSRHSSSAYLDLEQDLTSELTVAVAGRAERYSDFGSAVNFKVAARVSVLPGLALRGSLSSGFKAPSLQQQYFSTSSTNDVGGKLVNVGTFPATDAIAQALGATRLRPEKSRNFGAGVVFDRIDGLDIAVDWYRIAIRDRIVLTDNFGVDENGDPIDAVKNILDQAGDVGLQAARFFTNGVDTLTQGTDVMSSYRVPWQGIGDIRLTASFNHNETRITRYLDSLTHFGATSPLAGMTLFGRAESELMTRGQPRSKLNLGGEWTRRDWSATVRANRYGSVLSPGTDPRNDLVIEPAWVTDVELRYTRAAWRFALGAQNVFDQYPTAEGTGPRPRSLGGYYDANNYFIPFSVLSPFGFSGRFLYGRMSYRF
jgi:iron complex outermembrane receptor protein